MDADITQICHDISAGVPGAQRRLMDAVYEELRRMARGRLRGERADCTVQPTELVHEAWEKLLGRNPGDFESRQHFFGAAVQAMKRILIDHARKRKSAKHGGHLQREPLDGIAVPSRLANVDILALDDAMEQFKDLDPRAYDVVRHRIYLDLSMREVAEVLQIGERTAYEDWASAKAWLKQQLHSD